MNSLPVSRIFSRQCQGQPPFFTISRRKLLIGNQANQLLLGCMRTRHVTDELLFCSLFFHCCCVPILSECVCSVGGGPTPFCCCQLSIRADGAGGVTAESIDMLCREIKVDDCDAKSRCLFIPWQWLKIPTRWIEKTCSISEYPLYLTFSWLTLSTTTMVLHTLPHKA